MPVQALSLSVSSPLSAGKKTFRDGSITIPGLAVPIELENNCSEDDVIIESDDVALTNAIRKHFLEHFGHRDLKGTVNDYSEDAILMVQDDYGQRVKYHGHQEIESYFDHAFEIHPKGDSTFLLESIKVENRHAECVWSAKTPTLIMRECKDTFVFNSQGKIIKQFFTCDAHEREDTGTGRVVRRDSKDYEGFFKE
mmetsp:Transcript_6566/g.10403  ORF Transcript_6566/g.10403 Transcript_6566/m.10403 type:complete len:196 (+) Transcript_6566:63-650(+)|eukprot:CAMPEP_0194200524 /NCGR_PEP_ID=MMETSP0156-20130528/1091_1 /TAXON_ID=33649 /ORGANISM="Thalassionema nitzschioides, Strain L26-B" /LENGTH=195 /DNA_ID=CAMNT_0038925531 /DNA_START=36 /DNA_END=623 /DNA_ORIENTATION=+